MLRILIVACACGLVALPASASALGFTVDEAGDAPPTAAQCTDVTAGNCSLRDAIEAANTNAGDDSVSVPAGLGPYNLATASNEQNNQTGDLDIRGTGTEALTIDGTGGSAIVDANDIDRVIEMTGTSTGSVTLSDLTLRDGTTVNGSIVLKTGTAGPLTLDRVTLLDGAGGAALLGSGVSSTTLTDTLISGTVNGGGVDTNGSVDLLRTTISANNGGASAGGMRTGSGSIDRSTISGNSGSDGGIDNQFGMVISNSTISGNTATGVDGVGGLFHFSGGTLLLKNVTLAGNTGNGGGATLAVASLATIQTKNSVLTESDPDDTNCEKLGSGNIVSQGNNLQFPDAFSAPCAVAAPGDQAGDPKLGPLGANGGPTLTQLPAADSPLRDAGSACEGTVDQRGEARIQGPACDIGAVEAAPVPPVIPGPGTAPDPGPGGDSASNPGPGPPVGPGPNGNSGTLSVGKTTQNADGSVTVSCTVGGPGTLRAETPASAAAAKAKKKKKKPASIKPTSVTASQAGTLPIRLTLNSTGQRALKKKGSVPVKVKFTFAPSGGKATSVTRTIVFKKKTKKR